MEKLFSYMEKLIEIVGNAVSYLVLLIILIITYEVCMRYFFNAPTGWVHDLSGWLQAAFVMLGGGYALQKDHFIRVDVLYNKFSPKVKSFFDLTVSTLLFGLFIYVLLVKGSEFTYKSIIMNEVSATGAWQGKLWPAKMTVPAGAVLLIMAWLIKVKKDVGTLLEREG